MLMQMVQNHVLSIIYHKMCA